MLADDTSSQAIQPGGFLAGCLRWRDHILGILMDDAGNCNGLFDFLYGFLVPWSEG